MCSSSWPISAGIAAWCGWRIGSPGWPARTIARRLSPVSGLYACLAARGDTPVQANPVPRGLLTRRQGGSMRSRTVPLVRVPRTLPGILPPQEADRLAGALRTHRDRAMVLGMLLAGLRRCDKQAGPLATRAVARVHRATHRLASRSSCEAPGRRPAAPAEGPLLATAWRCLRPGIRSELQQLTDLDVAIGG
jgi:hypothetical protein